jgi:hypothetical protein
MELFANSNQMRINLYKRSFIQNSNLRRTVHKCQLMLSYQKYKTANYLFND